MIVTFTGIREIDPDDADIVELAVLDVLAMNPTELRFGGALGADTMALAAAAHADLRTRAYLVAYVPFTLKQQPLEARRAVDAFTDRVVELGLPSRKSSYLERNRLMLRGDTGDRSAPGSWRISTHGVRHGRSSLCVAFTDGRETGGTHATMVYANEFGIPVEVVPVRSLRKNPRVTGIDLTFKAWAFEEYDRAEKLTKIVRRNKIGEASTADIATIVSKLSRLIAATPDLRTADAIAAMPRRVPGAPSDMLPVAEALAKKFNFKVRHLGRKRRPQGGEFLAGRMRFTADEHESTFEYDGPVISSPLANGREHVILLDNVLTSGQTLEGAGRAVRATGSTPLGLAVLWGSNLGAHAA